MPEARTRAAQEPRPARPARKISLHARLGAWLAGLVIVLALALSAVLDRSAERQVSALSAAHLEALAEQMARELSQGMDGFAREIQTQALRERFRDPGADPRVMRAALDEFQRLNPEFAYAAVVDAGSAAVVAATGGIFEGGSARGRPVFEQGARGPFLGDVHDAVRLAELLPRPAGEETLRFLDVAAPVRDASGRVVRVLAAHVGWQWTASVRERVLGPLQARRQVEMVLLDTRGKVVMGSPRTLAVGTDLTALARRGARPPGMVRWPDGATYLTVVVPTTPHGAFAGFGWQVVARQPEAAALAPLDRLRAAFALGALGLGLAGAAAAWLIARRLTTPLRRFAHAAERVGAGGSESELPPEPPLDELQPVRRALARLAETARVHTAASDASERQFTVLAQALPHLVWQAGPDGRLQYVNHDWVQAEGVTHVEGLGRFVAPEDRPAFSAAWQASRASGEALRLHLRFRPPGAAEARWSDVEARAVPTRAGAVARWVGTVADAHERTLLAQRTRRALEDERSARAEAERIGRMRDEFIATASHELRTPLSAIAGWSEILLRHAGADAKVLQAAAVIRRNALRQAALIDDLLDMTALLGARMAVEPAPLDLGRLAGDVVQARRAEAQAKGVELGCACEDAVPVMADPARFAQALSAVVGNALKFTGRGGRVAVWAGIERGQATVRVQDTGCGIAPDFLPRVFERMSQADRSLSRGTGGLGLGLAIARGIVELHGGTIAAHSAGTGLGATFTLTLPLAVEAGVPAPEADVAQPEPPALDAQASLRGLRVLLVDDEPDAREVAQTALTSLGAHVVAASTGAQALSLLEEVPVDVLVSDIAMPAMDGLQLLAQVRSAHGAAAPPAVALTALAADWQRRDALAAGFRACVTKPLSLRRLYDALVHADPRGSDAPP